MRNKGNEHIPFSSGSRSIPAPAKGPTVNMAFPRGRQHTSGKRGWDANPGAGSLGVSPNGVTRSVA